MRRWFEETVELQDARKSIDKGLQDAWRDVVWAHWWPPPGSTWRTQRTLMRPEAMRRFGASSPPKGAPGDRAMPTCRQHVRHLQSRQPGACFEEVCTTASPSPDDPSDRPRSRHGGSACRPPRCATTTALALTRTAADKSKSRHRSACTPPPHASWSAIYPSYVARCRPLEPFQRWHDAPFGPSRFASHAFDASL